MAKGSKKINTSVVLEADLHSYVGDLAAQADRTRSWVINALIRKHEKLVREKKVEAELPDPAMSVINV